MKIETLAVHAGQHPERGTRDVTPAIHLATTFQKADDGTLPGGYLYSRPNNPNREALESALALLEGGTTALSFSSGSAATFAVLQSLSPADHVIVGEDVFYGTLVLLRTIMANWGVTFTQVRMQDLPAVERAITPKTRLFWVETPSNPMLAVTDLRAVISVAKRAGAIVACDNTVGTPMLQRPLELGADISMHSVTKFLSGHSDVLSGALVFREGGPLLDRIRHIQQQSGGVPSPFECWLTLRGLQSFPYRMRGICASAQRIAEFLNSHPKVEAVHYPGLPKHPGHGIAAAQMSGGFGGLMSMQVKGGQADAFKVLAAVKIFTHATSLGGTHSLIEHRASVEGPDTRSPANLLRLSIGLEHPDDLIEDLLQALNAV